MRCMVSWQEEKKPEQGKKEEPKGKEEKKEEGKGEDGKKGGGEGEKKEGGGEEKKADEPPPPPPEEIVMRVYMHCEGCARKVKRSLKGFEGNEGCTFLKDPKNLAFCSIPSTKLEMMPDLLALRWKGVEDVKTDCRTHKVVVKGKKAAEDPMKVVERAAEPDLKASQVTVKGVFDPHKLGEYVYKRTGKQAVVAKQEPAEKKAEDGKGGGGDAAKDEKKADEAGGGNAEGEKKEEKDGGGGQGGGDEKDKKEGGGAAEDGAAPATKVVELVRNEFYQYYPRYQGGYVGYAYPPQIFSDENPNACAVM
ncbi:hypothetical protein GW17_00017806 [Ensete ventricosum]|nr:hypothetical protein GW17_00017806 [Ensete ventricosum]